MSEKHQTEGGDNMLPETGGIGVNLFYAVGVLLIIGSVFLAVMKGMGGK